MQPLSIIPSIIAISLALTCCFALNHFIKGISYTNAKFESIAGLKGYLAFFVFLHHSAIWYFYLRTGQWTSPPSQLYTHFGDSSVIMFFMITSFLFSSKIFDKNTQYFDWLKFFISRIMRLFPLYLVSMIAMFSIVGILTSFVINVPISQLLAESFKWLNFTMHGFSPLNKIDETWVITAGVTWSFRYEFLFYFSLPILAKLFTPLNVPISTLTLVCILIFSIFYFNPPWYQFSYSFIGGIVAAFAVKSEKLCTTVQKPIFSLVVIAILSIVVIFYNKAFLEIPSILLTVAFIIIAGGKYYVWSIVT